MCSGSTKKPTHSCLVMDNNEIEKQNGFCYNLSFLLELSASNDLIGFKRAIEEDGHDVDELSLWYGTKIGSKKMGLEERTPLMIAALFGSLDVLDYIIETGCADVNRSSSSDGASALHCAAAGGSASSVEVIKRLLDASADPNAVDVNGNLAGDLVARIVGSDINSPRKALEIMLEGGSSGDESSGLAHQIPVEFDVQQPPEVSTPMVMKDGTEKKEYPVDVTLPDIKNGIYSTDEFRMYTFKVKPCSRAYSHDWTECPFVHPGENARRRDPRKYHYSCVPCPEFRKGSCPQGDTCEYAHGIFECWLHPAQYRTRLCKDETNCTRRVCFFAHEPEELRPLYASTGSAVPSPKSYSVTASASDIGSLSSFSLGSPSLLIPPSSPPPMTPTRSSSPLGGWLNQSTIISPTLQLPGSRLRPSLSARNMELDMELLSLDGHFLRQQLMDDLSGLSSPSGMNNLSAASAFAASSGTRTGEVQIPGGMKPTKLADVFGSIDPSILPQLQGLSSDATTFQLLSPKGAQTCQNIKQQLRSSYPTNFSSSPMRTTTFRMDPSCAADAKFFSSSSAAFAKRSQSFVERSAVNRHSGFSLPTFSAATISSNYSDWGSPDGKLDWGVQREELDKLRRSASFSNRNSRTSSTTVSTSMPATLDEPDMTWVQTLVKDTSSMDLEKSDFEEHPQCHFNHGGPEMVPAWVEQLYIEQEQVVA